MSKEEKTVVHFKMTGTKTQIVRWQKALTRYKSIELVKTEKNSNRFNPDSPFSEIFKKIGTKKCFCYFDARIIK